MRIRNKLLVVILCVTLCFGVVAVTGVMVVGGLLVDQVREKLIAIADHTMENIHRLFIVRYDDIRMLASEPALKAGPGAPGAIQETFSGYMRHFRAYAPYLSLSYFDLERVRLVDSSGRDVGIRHSLSEYWLSIKAGREFVLHVSVSESVKAPVFHLAHLVRNQAGIPSGVVVARILVGALHEVITRPLRIFRDSGTFKVDLVACDGRYLYSSHDPGSVLVKKSPVFALAQRRASDRDTLLLENPFNKKDSEIIVYTWGDKDKVWKGNEWLLTISVPERAAMAPVRLVRLRMLVALVIIAFVTILTGVLVARSITRPLELLADAVTAVGGGRLTTEIGYVGKNEVGLLAASFNRMVKDLNLLEAELKIAATLDPLTGVYNRGKLGQVLAAEVARSHRYRHPLAVVMVDIDHFKRVNDTFGHQEGDGVLSGLCERINGHIRATDILGRWGGEEFIIMLPETTREAAVVLAGKIRELVAGETFGTAGTVTISCGVAGLQEGETVDSLLARVDAALYLAKANGRNRVEVADLG